MARLAKISHPHRIYTFQATLQLRCTSKGKCQTRSTGHTNTNNSHWQRTKCSKWAISPLVLNILVNRPTTRPLQTTKISSFCKERCLRLQCKIILCHNTTPREFRHQYFLVIKRTHLHIRHLKTRAECNLYRLKTRLLSNFKEWTWHLNWPIRKLPRLQWRIHLSHSSTHKTASSFNNSKKIILSRADFTPQIHLQ